MQYNHTVTIQFIEEFDDYGQPLAGAVVSKSMRCCILSESVSNRQDETKRKNQYDMEILVSAKTYAPYSQLFNDNVITVIRGGRTYGVERRAQINSFGGKAKYYQISLNQVWT